MPRAEYPPRPIDQEVTSADCDFLWRLASVQALEDGRPVLYVFANLVRERVVRAVEQRLEDDNK